MFGSRGFLGGVDPDAPLSPRYGSSRFDSINRGIRDRFGGGVRYRMNGGAATATQRKKPGRAAPVALVPFGAAAHRHTEPFYDASFTPGTTTQQVGPIDVPSYGFIRHVYVLVTTSGGVAGSGVLDEDAPFNVFSSVQLSDVNGAPIFGPLDGFQAFLANLYGGYAFQQDPRLAPDYNGSSVVGFTFGLRIPVEIHGNNGLGSLANQNSAASYKLSMTLNTIANIWSVTTGLTAPTVRIRCYLEAWSLPDAVDRAGRPQAQLPPLHGTTQFWSVSSDSVSTGRDTVKISRVGNLIRTLIFICRSSGTRTTADFPEVLELWWDNRQLLMEHRNFRRQLMMERFIHSSAGVPAGVFAFDFDHDVLGHGGDGTPELWLPTVQSTRLELQGTWDASDVEILVNDVAPVEVNQAQRYVETSETGFEPAV